MVGAAVLGVAAAAGGAVVAVVEGGAVAAPTGAVVVVVVDEGVATCGSVWAPANVVGHGKRHHGTGRGEPRAQR